MKNLSLMLSALFFAGILSFSACSSEKKTEQTEETTEVAPTAAEIEEDTTEAIEEIEEEVEGDSTVVEGEVAPN
ncbi:MAG: hypothetical protein ACFCUU_14365 [Cyclobacteriaceae bacterium]